MARLRFGDDAPPGVQTAVVKWVRNSHDRSDPRQARNEAAALRFLGHLGVPLAARLLADDPERGVLLLEDLAPRRPLSGRLYRKEPAAAAGLHAFAAATGALAAATAGAHDRWLRERVPSDPPLAVVDQAAFWTRRWEATLAATAAIDLPLSVAAEHELARVLDELADPGPFLSFSGGDTGVNNAVVDDAGGDIRLIDFEFAHFGHALVGGAALWVPSPQFLWIGNPAESGQEDDLRAALAVGVPEAKDDRRFSFGMAAAAATLTAERLCNLAVYDARPPGHSSRRHRIAGLDAAVDCLAHHRRLPHLRGWLESAAATLRRMWPDADLDYRSLRPYTPRPGPEEGPFPEG